MTDDLFPLTFVILGQPRAWKNSKSGFIRRGGARGQRCPCCRTPLLVDLVHSKAAKSWMKSAIEQLEAQWRYAVPIPKTVDLNAKIVSYLGTRRLVDADNLYGGAQDALQSAKILEDDSCIVSHNGSERLYDKERPRTEITLTRKRADHA